MLKLVPNKKESACLLSSDFPTENPRTQNRNFPYTKPLPFIAELTRKRKIGI